jgi:hypothetical protein
MIKINNKIVRLLLNSFLFILCFSSKSWAINFEKGEQDFILATNIGKQIDKQATASKSDYLKMKTLLLSSANAHYNYAPYALCIFLSVDNTPIINLQDAYSWCQVATQYKNKYSSYAYERGLEILGKISLHQGLNSLMEAKKHAQEHQKKYWTTSR